jgi:AbiV family abortive infection protein
MAKINHGYLDKVPEEELKNCAEHAVRNAHQYIEDAKTLARKKSYGHAYALLVLSVEEAVKALACKERLDGRLDKGKFKDFFIYHKSKQKFVFRDLIEEVTALTIMFYMPFLSKEAKRLIKMKQKETKRVDGEIPTFSEIIKPEIEEILKQKDKILEQMRRLHENMQKRKEVGLYVDFTLESKLISPDVIDKEETEKLLEYAGSLYAIVHDTIIEGEIYYMT